LTEDGRRRDRNAPNAGGRRDGGRTKVGRCGTVAGGRGDEEGTDDGRRAGDGTEDGRRRPDGSRMEAAWRRAESRTEAEPRRDGWGRRRDGGGTDPGRRCDGGLTGAERKRYGGGTDAGWRRDGRLTDEQQRRDGGGTEAARRLARRREGGMT
jgi:hypothetical protein